MTKFNITIQRIDREEYQMELEADQVMTALDQARKIAEERNKTSTTGQYSVIKIEEKYNEQS